MNEQLIEQLRQIGLRLGVNGLPYKLPIHPNLVHFTIGLFIIAIIFDIAGTLFPLEKPILKFVLLPAWREGFYDVGWYNVVAAAGITFATVAVGFFEMLLAQPPLTAKTDWGLGAGTTMLLHGVGGVVLLTSYIGMAVWRGYQRFSWRKGQKRQVQFGYLVAGVFIMGALYVHGTLGAQLGDDLGFHNTAGHMVRIKENPNVLLKQY